MNFYGGIEQPSISEVARRFLLPESTVRTWIKKYDLPRDLVLRNLQTLRERALNLADELDQLEAMILAERERRAA